MAGRRGSSQRVHPAVYDSDTFDVMVFVIRTCRGKVGISKIAVSGVGISKC